MIRRLSAIAVIFLVATVAWVVLTASIASRTSDSTLRLSPGVESAWGAPQEQVQPAATVAEVDAPPAATTLPVDSERTRVRAAIALDYRQKGLLWYSTYVVRFAGAYTFRNPSAQPRRITLNFYFPAQEAIYDDLAISVNGQALPVAANKDGAAAWAMASGGQALEFQVTYQSHGMESWRYKFGDKVSQTRDFQLVLDTNFRGIDFPANTLSPTVERKTGNGWELEWRYRNLISGFEIGMALPQRTQPGPLAARISAFAPVSLLLFFFALLMLATLRKIDLHPVNYAFLAAAFFAFHLLLAYSADHISIFLAFGLSSAVSVALVVSYLRLVVGPRFAIAEAGTAQMVFLVLFSFSFFLRSYTGLAITIGCIFTLFAAMQLTARVVWHDV